MSVEITREKIIEELVKRAMAKGDRNLAGKINSADHSSTSQVPLIIDIVWEMMAEAAATAQREIDAAHNIDKAAAPPQVTSPEIRSVESRALEYIFGMVSAEAWRRLVEKQQTPPRMLPGHEQEIGLRMVGNNEKVVPKHTQTVDCLQKLCLEHGFDYVRASDDHYVMCTREQATSLLRKILGVDVHWRPSFSPKVDTLFGYGNLGPVQIFRELRPGLYEDVTASADDITNEAPSNLAHFRQVML